MNRQRNRMKTIDIDREPVELFKILKFEGIAASGAQAKALVADGKVKVNEVLETQKSKKIKSGDKIDVDGQWYMIRLVNAQSE